MSLPNTNLEQAVTYASFSSDGSLEVSSQMDEDQRRQQYSSLLDKVQNPIKVASLLVRLEEDTPYFQLCSDENVHSYFQRFGVPISSRKDLELFIETLGDRVRTLADSNETVKAQLAERDYRNRLAALPSAISKLEEQVNKYDALKKPFAAVMRYVWEAIVLQGFKMSEDGSKASELYRGKITIKPHPKNAKAVHIKIDLKEKLEDSKNILEFVFKPIYKIKTITKERTYFWDKKEKVQTEEVDFFVFLPMRQFDGSVGYNCGNYGEKYICKGINEYSFCTIINNPSSFIDLLMKETLANPDQNTESFETYLKLIFNLPKLMHNYADRTRVNLGDVLGRIVDENTNDN
jgi:hypothetical protein